MEFLGVITTGIRELRDIILSYRIFIIAFFISLTGMALLNLSDSLLDIFFITDVRNTHIELIGIVSFSSLLIAFSGLAYYIGAWLFGLGRNKYRLFKQEQNEVAVLKQLTPVECEYLAHYIREQTQTSYFSPSDGVVGGLESKGILYRSSNLGRVHQFAYNIQPWAYEHLNKNPQILFNKLSSESEVYKGP